MAMACEDDTFGTGSCGRRGSRLRSAVSFVAGRGVQPLASGRPLASGPLSAATAHPKILPPPDPTTRTFPVALNPRLKGRRGKVLSLSQHKGRCEAWDSGAISRITITTQVRHLVLHRFPFLVTYIARGRGVLIFALAHAPLATGLSAGESRAVAGCGRRTILALPK